MKGLKGKRIIIGGGATGIGAATARRLVAEGARVAVGDVNEAALAKVLPELQKAGDAIAAHFDLAEEATINHLVQHAVDTFGGLDGTVHTGADLSQGTMGNDINILELNVSVWDRTHRVNFLGHALLMKAAIPHMQAAGGGAIAVVASSAAHEGFPFFPAYAASKASLNAPVRHVASLCGKDNIRCNAVSPATVLTEGGAVNLTPEVKVQQMARTPLGRLGDPDEIAAMLVYLLSDESPWLTGQVISMNGGAFYRE